jgi:hypothetical protein
MAKLAFFFVAAALVASAMGQATVDVSGGTTTVAAPGTMVNVNAPQAVKSGPQGPPAVVNVKAPAATVTVVDANGKALPTAKQAVPATKQAVPVTKQGPPMTKPTTANVAAGPATATVAAAPGAPVVTSVRAPTTGVDVVGQNVAAGGAWGSVVRTPAGVQVDVPFFSGSFPGGRRMLRA